MKDIKTKCKKSAELGPNSSDILLDSQNAWASHDIDRALRASKDLVYDPCKFECSVPLKEAESAEYGAYAFKLNNLSIRFRVAKITPTKIGQFVTLWKRIASGPIQPYDILDPVDFFVVSTGQGDQFGQFIFPKTVLFEQDIVSNLGKGGKRAIRVYPPWDQTASRQAQKTQAWQMEYFLEIPNHKPIDCARAQMLYSQK
jgi:hypothetical protein